MGFFLLLHESMKDHMERLVVLPFSIDCISLSSNVVASTTTQSKKSDQESNSFVTRRKEAAERPTRVKRKTSWGLLALRRSFISRGIHKLINSFKCFSQLFVYRGEIIEDTEMEIGFPTDVKHVSHIGWDGSMSSGNPIKGWENLITPQLLSFPSISLRQFELAMASQADALVGSRPE